MSHVSYFSFLFLSGQSHIKGPFTLEKINLKNQHLGVWGEFPFALLEYPIVKTSVFDNFGFWCIVRMCHLLVLCMREHGSVKYMNNSQFTSILRVSFYTSKTGGFSASITTNPLSRGGFFLWIFRHFIGSCLGSHF